MEKRRLKRRLCSLILCLTMVMSPVLPGAAVKAASAVVVYAAAYQNADDVKDTTLPAKVTIDGTQKDVTWQLRKGKFSVPYHTVEVNGTTKDKDDVKAQVEIIPEKENKLLYFVDAGRDSGKESKAYDSVKELTGATMKNMVADQAYNDASKWGRVDKTVNGSTVFRLKGEEKLDLTQKFQTGWYSGFKTEPLVYQFYLEPGEYTVGAGFYEWWNGRSMKLKLSGAGMQTVQAGPATVSGIGASAVASATFKVDTACAVKMEIQNTTEDGEAPVISWFAVSEGKVDIPESMPVDTEIHINGADVEAAAKNQNGLTYKGYGILSGNSTSDLLMDYKEESPEVYEEMMQVLFGGEHPLMTHVKMEMGNDGNNSTGADSCTMRTENEEADVSRSPGFQLAADAKAVNPDVKVSFLRWEMPSWVQEKWNSDKTGAGYEAVYKWYRETVFDAYEKYGYVVDYISPDKNETTNPDGAFIKWFKNRISNEKDFPAYMDQKAKDAYKNIKIIASDENTSLNIVPAMRSDKDLYNVVDAVGFHYRAGDETSTKDYRTLAAVDDKEVWYSEGCATFGYTEYQENKTTAYGANSIGGYQSPLALADNFIKSFVYSHKTHYIFQPALGSFYEGAQYDHKEILSAREPWAGYVHYDPVIYMLQHFSKFSVSGWENSDNTSGIWRAIPQASGNNSSGSDHLKNESGNPSYMTLASPDKKDFSVVIVNNSNKPLEYKVKVSDMDLKKDAQLEIWETKTDSYMQYKGTTVYEDGYYWAQIAPYSMVTLTTLDCDKDTEYTDRLPDEVEKAVLDTDASGKKLNKEDKILYADDYEYAGYDKDYLKNRGKEPRYTVDVTGAFEVENGQMKQLLNQSVSQWNAGEPNCIVGDFRWMNYKAGVDVTVADSSYAGINIRQQTGMTFEGSGYGLTIKKDGSWTLKKRGTVLKSGTANKNENGTYHLALEGRNNVITAWVDGKEVASYTDENPESFGRVRLGCGWKETTFDNLKIEKLDGCEPYAETLIDNASDDVSYTGTWDITGGAGSSNDWYRSISTTTEAGASFSFGMDGAGFALIGENDGSAVLDISIDGEKTFSNVATKASSQHYAALLQRGLGSGAHQVTVEVKSGKLVLDAILTLPALDESAVIANDEVSAVTYEGRSPSLPRVVSCTTAGGEKIKKAVTWDISGHEWNAYDKVQVSGKLSDSSYTLTASVEVVPRNLVYFIDAGTGSGYLNQNETAAVSKPFLAVSKYVKKLRNDASDAAYTEESGWGYVGDSQTYKVSSTIDGGDRPDQYTGTDKYLTGLRDKTAGAQPMIYRFTLDAGEYQLTAGYHEFYGANRVRDMQPSVVWTDSEGTRQEVKGSLIELRSADQKSTIDFTLEEKTVVEYHLDQVAGEAPMYSWLAVNEIVKKEQKPVDKIFEDIQLDDWHKDYVQYVFDKGIMTGMDPTHFGPGVELSRAQFAVILYRMEESPDAVYENKFKDVPDNEFYTKAVMWASSEEVGVINGYADKTFGPADFITREQFATMMYRYASYRNYDVKAKSDLKEFSDRDKVSEFAKEAVSWAVAEGLILGDQGKVNPQGNASRAVCATIIQRFIEKYE